MKTVFFTSDTHFGHKNILKYCPRPYTSVEEMDEALIDNWNDVVAQGDTVYHLGDFAFAPPDRVQRIIKRLNGNKTLILGNHDKAIQKHPDHYPLFTEIIPYKEISVNKQFIVLSHYSHRVWNRGHYGAWHLWGHSHNTLEPFGKSVDVGIDSSWVLGTPKYAPFSFDEIKAFMDTRDWEKVDHHGRQ